MCGHFNTGTASITLHMYAVDTGSHGYFAGGNVFSRGCIRVCTVCGLNLLECAVKHLI